MIHPLNCREVTTRLALGDVSQYTWHERLMIHFHLMICWVCRKYERQIKVIAKAFQMSAEQQKKSLFTPAFRDRLQAALRQLK